ncbi:bacillithiol system protein YtxJ [Tenacibaculum adriaticum]|uniref:Bacillithiol system protein YtxJ n=1 Tax=Tenacibaculum adriaticum TaxID=413713 RepID=A0A5S5DVR4_9FLAO|nr:bacillithiol system redox-active protein YtxJ [Tenacibaculum adriaticum]TYP98872.1 bacillithiol system protein YtxJ [Tenacibaculum adriaticum]
MGIFENIFGKTSNSSENKEHEESKIKWIPLTSIQQIKEIKNLSKTNLVGIFKHSTRCVISRTVLDRFQQVFPENNSIKMYYLDLLNYRDVSNEIEVAFQVLHQSPQFLLIKEENPILHASHYDITQINFQKIIK